MKYSFKKLSIKWKILSIAIVFAVAGAVAFGLGMGFGYKKNRDIQAQDDNWADTVYYNWWDTNLPSGTDTDYEIRSDYDLVTFSYMTNFGYLDEGTTVKQTVDIDLSVNFGGLSWIPICMTGSAYEFSYSYDGGGHTISNVNINADIVMQRMQDNIGVDFTAHCNIGLFGTAGQIKNLFVDNLFIYNSSAIMEKPTDEILDEVSYEWTLSSHVSCGGIVGRLVDNVGKFARIEEKFG